jgi:signal transduction histidine kinase
LVNKAPRRADTFDVNEVITDAVALTRDEIFKNRVALDTQLAKDLPPVQGDRVQLQQVVVNLVMNAVEAMNAVEQGNRALQIGTARVPEDSVSITVRDSGPPLKPEGLDRFFDAFYSTKASGMGIGLAICRFIIEAHGGRIWATANVPRGATLHITLPARGS